jgi:hypothetical protein
MSVRLSLGLVSLAALAAAAAPSVRPPPPDALRSSYQLRLTSAWPAPSGETEACNNRATEVLEGTLHRVSGTRYEGRFHRSTAIGFCGAHGAATADAACAARLEGSGEVIVTGDVAPAGTAAATMTLLWRPDAARTAAAVRGTCAGRFQGALKAMYLTVSQRVDFTVPVETGAHSLALEDYGWTLDIE